MKLVKGWKVTLGNGDSFVTVNWNTQSVQNARNLNISIERAFVLRPKNSNYISYDLSSAAS